MEFVDTHCHPHFDVFLPSPDKVIDDALSAGVSKMIAVGTTLDDSARAVEFAQTHQGKVWSSVGVHPHEASNFVKNKSSTDRLKQILNKSSIPTLENKFSGSPIVAVGEIGLDYYKNFSSKDDQLSCLRIQIEATVDLGLPYIFHIREAWQDFWPLLDNYPNLRGVIHSFSTNPEQLDHALSRGLYIGLNGIMTFTNDDSQLAAAKKVPLNKLLLETDAPFLAPKPFRGKTCEPKHVVTTAEFLSGLRGEQLADLAAATTANAKELFGLEPK